MRVIRPYLDNLSKERILRHVGWFGSDCRIYKCTPTHLFGITGTKDLNSFNVKSSRKLFALDYSTYNASRFISRQELEAAIPNYDAVFQEITLEPLRWRLRNADTLYTLPLALA